MPNPSAFWAMLLPRARRIPWVVHWHADVVASCIDRRLSAAYRLYRPFEHKLLALSKIIIATSPSYLDSSQPLAPWKSKCVTVPLGLDPAGLPTPAPDTLRQAHALWPGKGLKILAVGRLTYYKGHEVLLHALTGLPDACLCLVGEGEQRARLETLIKSLHLEKRVLLLGHQSEPIRNGLLSTCDLVCLPSIERTEAFGLVLLEAMRYGKAVVAADIPGSGVGWVVENTKTGQLVEPGNSGMLAEALGFLAGSPSLRDAMGRAGATRFQEHFHIHHVARRIKTIYGDVIADTGDS
jgi:rhamnosyl/mannosyltransferase